MQSATPGCPATFTSATSARTEKKGVNTWPHWSMTVRFQFQSDESRVEVTGTPRSRQLFAFLTAGSALVRAHRPPLTAVCEIASKLAVSRDTLVRLLWKLNSPPNIGFLKT